MVIWIRRFSKAAGIRYEPESEFKLPIKSSIGRQDDPFSPLEACSVRSFG